MKVKISPEKMEVIEQFAYEYYFGKEKAESVRRQDRDSDSRRVESTIIGKMAEEAVAMLFETDTKPDYTVYRKGSKMVEPDLRKGNLTIHVKSTRSKRLGWMADPTTDHIVNNPTNADILAMTVVNVNTAEVELVGFSVMSELREQWQQPHRADLQHKRVIYPTIFDKNKSTLITPRPL